jgi:GrpB-like predicted nucleotidyltransferase (UPF0157 family)
VSVVLEIGVTSPASTGALRVVQAWSGPRVRQGTGGPNDRTRGVDLEVLPWPVSWEDTTAHHLIVGVRTRATDNLPFSETVDVWITPDQAAELWQQRIVPFRDNLAAGRRAPRRLVAVLFDPDPAWPVQARRLIARLTAVMGSDLVRVDHIGSTSVPGLPAKDLIDVQAVVPDLDTADRISRHARRAGFVRVPGQWFGLAADGRRFEEIVLVDADPARPVNINLRPVRDPVWREVLLFRDWLRADQTHRDAYLDVKRRLERATTHVNDYGDGKLPWISQALRAAEDWAQHTHWTAAPPRTYSE